MTSASPGFPSAAASRGRAWLPWILILLVALAARLAFVIALPPNFVFSDTRDYDQIARWLLDQHTFGHVPLRAPGYPAFMALVYAVSGRSVTALRCVEAVLGTLSVGLIARLGVRLFGRPSGLIAGAIAAVHPVMAFLPSAIYTENLLVFLLVVALSFAFDALDRPGLWRWAASGAWIGLAMLVRPNVIALLPGLALGFTLLAWRARRALLRPLLATGAAVLLTVLPWLVRNHQVYGRWFYICTGGGRQFYLGNNPLATGETWIHPDPDPETAAALARLPDAFARDHYLYQESWRFIREHPARAAQLYLIELGNLYALHPETVTRTLMNRWSRATQTVASLVVFAGALMSLARWRTAPPLWPLALSALTFSLANALVYSSMRYRMVFEPCLILMAGLGWTLVLNLLPRRAARAGAAV